MLGVESAKLRQETFPDARKQNKRDTRRMEEEEGEEEEKEKERKNEEDR